MVNRDEYRQMVLAGTVSFPATFPQVGRISLTLEKIPASHQPDLEFLSVTESPSARVNMVRRVMVKSVRAVFIPRDPRQVSYADGEWLLGDEVLPGLSCKLKDSSTLQGIVFVPENEPSMLNVSVGMTAAESVQYYPPLPNDLLTITTMPGPLALQVEVWLRKTSRLVSTLLAPAPVCH